MLICFDQSINQRFLRFSASLIKFGGNHIYSFMHNADAIYLCTFQVIVIASVVMLMDSNIEFSPLPPKLDRRLAMV